MDKTYICGYSRTPIGSFQGILRDLSAWQLGAETIKAIITKTNININNIDEVIMGNVLSAGVGQAPARQASIYAGLLEKTRCMTINKVCGSGLKAIMLADQAIRLNDADIIIAGGMESMSQAPYLIKKSRGEIKFGHSKLIDSILNDGLWDPYNNIPMGSCAEVLNKEMNFTREEQDDFAIQSYTRSNDSIKKSLFANEISPIKIPAKKGEIVIDTDEEPLKFNKEKIRKLNPAFETKGSITAANASSINDGAAVVLLSSKKSVKELKLAPIARIVAQTSVAIDPLYFTKAPIEAIRMVLKKSKLSLDDIDLFEINEAFSCVTMVAMKELNLSNDKVNILGGAVSLGHPIGASGCRILVTLLNALEIKNKKFGLAAICIGGGEASAIIVERITDE